MNADFFAVVGPDFAGKSTVLATLQREHGWRVVSYDDCYLEAYPLIRQLRASWIDDAFTWAHRRYSPELVLATLNPIILHLRDELERSAGHPKVIVDSYYYKLLAKCRLLGVVHEPLFDYWRGFTPPRHVLYLNTSPETTWRRSGFGADVNDFERYPDPPGAAGFCHLQSDLRAAVLAELGATPVTELDAGSSPETLLTDVLAALHAQDRP